MSNILIFLLPLCGENGPPEVFTGPSPKKLSSPWPLSRNACWELPPEWAESAGQMLRVDSSNCLKSEASICLRSGLVSSG